MRRSSLYGKKVLLTRPKEQSLIWSRHLLAEGAFPVIFPLIEIKPLPVTSEVKTALKNLKNYDYLVFTSRNAAYIFLDLLGRKNISISILPEVYAVGPATQEFLTEKGIKAKIPEDYNSGELVRAIPDIKGKKVLVPQSKIAASTLGDGMRDRGALVTFIPIYTTITKLDIGKELKSVLSGGIDVITFASPSAVDAFTGLIDNFKEYIFACIGETTAQRAGELGLQQVLVAKEQTIAGLIESIKDYFTHETAKKTA